MILVGFSFRVMCLFILSLVTILVTPPPLFSLFARFMMVLSFVGICMFSVCWVLLVGFSL
ncbi:hypothetical protein FN846DRAFT_966635 [Sphaerosporella brunnea]|uniref:Uncharacterized protein n=1 Tax=Sphaerosporella brunnea TaxID=1250544 RepID=A0A5J5EKA4_9PEZI|nr:hypothetical protein FN846DRAFT_966635 [Sphaerosporella brunnea]